jgi:hypothetical protein
MSIIYDALRKVEGKVQDEEVIAVGQHSGREISFVRVGLICVAVLIAGYLLAQFMFSSNAIKEYILQGVSIPGAMKGKPRAPVEKKQQEQAALPPAAVKGAQKMTYVLNGLFSADNASYALINNSIVQAGDTIEGAKVVRITADNVELEVDGRTITLSNKKY